MITVPPHPFVLDDPSEVPLEECWMARPQLFFTCFLRPVDGRPPKRAMDSDTYGPDDIRADLVLFSTFEDLDLPGSGPMETRGVTKYYEPSPTPILYVGPISNVLGRVPLMPFPPRQLYTDHPTRVPSPQSQQIPIRLRRCFRRVRQEGKQRLRGEPVDVGVWKGKASSGGSVSD